jgi:hypothetical protein
VLAVKAYVSGLPAFVWVSQLLFEEEAPHWPWAENVRATEPAPALGWTRATGGLKLMVAAGWVMVKVVAPAKMVAVRGAKVLLGVVV